MAEAYTSEGQVVSSSTWRKVRGYVNAWLSSNADGSAVIGWSVSAQFQNAYQYGVRVKCYVDGSEVGNSTGYLTSDPGSTWTTAASASGTTTVSKTQSSRSVPVKVYYHLEEVSGYGGGGGGSGEATVNVSIGALTSHTVTYNANGGSGAPSSQTKWYGSVLTLSSTKPTRSGYTFLGWGTSASTTTVSYAAGAKYGVDQNITLYAIWSKSITLTYNANGGSGAPSAQIGTIYNATTSYKFTVSSTKPTRTGYTFLGWSTSSTATSSSYSSGGSITLSSSTTIYAIWSKTITLSYNANGGSGAPSSQSATVYNSTTSYKFTLSSTKPTRSGYTFLGWSTSNTATSSSYSPGGTITISSSTPLYAVWRENTLTVTYYSNYADFIDPTVTLIGDVNAEKSVAIYKNEYKYATAYSYGLPNYSSSGGSLCMTRTRYDATGYWCTTSADEVKLEGNKNEVLKYEGGIAIGEDMALKTGQELAQALGLTLASGDKTISLYAHWVLLASRITVYQPDGAPVKGLCHIYDDEGNRHYAIFTVYGQDGKAREVV